MTLKEYATQVGIPYRKAHYRFKCGELVGAFQTQTGIIVIPEGFTYQPREIAVNSELFRRLQEEELSQELLQTILDYSPVEGTLVWKQVVHSACKLGASALATNPKYYPKIQLGGKRYPTHKIVYMLVTGAYPVGEIDHVDTDILNIKWDNLRPASRSEQNCNKRRYKNNTSGVKGVTFEPITGKWRAGIRLNNKTHNLGLFSNLEEAKEKITIYRNNLHKEFARHE